MRVGILSGIVCVGAISACVASCSSSSSSPADTSDAGADGATSGSDSGGPGDDAGNDASSDAGSVGFSAQFSDLENKKKSDGGVETYKVQVKLFDQPFTCANYNSPTGAYSFIKLNVENASQTGVIAPGTYTVDGVNIYVEYSRIDATGHVVDAQAAKTGTITLTTVTPGSSASGSFDVQMAEVDGGSNAEHLAATFSANACP